MAAGAIAPKPAKVGLCLTLLVLCLGIRPGGAAETFQLITGFVEIAERGRVPSYIILTESNRFTFLPPPGWNISHNASERKVTLVPKDLGASLSFSILPADTAAGKALSVEELKDQLLVRFPDAKIVRDSPCFSGGNTGRAFDLERLVGKKSPVSMRVAIVPFQGGKLEFSLTAATPSFPKYQQTFGALLGSFQIEPASPSRTPKP